MTDVVGSYKKRCVHSHAGTYQKQPLGFMGEAGLAESL